MSNQEFFIILTTLLNFILILIYLCTKFKYIFYFSKKNNTRMIVSHDSNCSLYNSIVDLILKNYSGNIYLYSFEKDNLIHNIKLNKIMINYLNKKIFIKTNRIKNTFVIEGDNYEIISNFCNEYLDPYSKENKKNYIYQICNNIWTKNQFKLNKTFNNTFIDQNIMEDINNKILLFNEQFNDPLLNFINNKLFFVFYGEKGNGRKSFVQAISHQYNKNIYKISIDHKCENIMPLIKLIPEDNIIYIEDNNKLENNNVSNLLNSSISDNWFDQDKKIIKVNQVNKNNMDDKIKNSHFVKQIIKNSNNNSIIILKTNNIENYESSLFNYKILSHSYEFKKPNIDQIMNIYKYFSKQKDEIPTHAINKKLINLDVSQIINQYVLPNYKNTEKIKEIFFAN